MQPWKWDPCEVTEGGRRCYHCDNCDVALQDATAAARGDAHAVTAESAQYIYQAVPEARALQHVLSFLK